MRTFNPDTMTITPRAFASCIPCHATGDLVGQWYDAVDVDELTPSDIHGGPTSHEEIWISDTEHLPVVPGSGEMTPAVAAQWGKAIESITPMWREAYIAWIEDQYIREPEDAPSDRVFCCEILAGHFESFRAFAEQIAGDIDLLHGVPEEVARYFDWDSYARDLEVDYTVIDTPSYDVWVFHNQ